MNSTHDTNPIAKKTTAVVRWLVGQFGSTAAAVGGLASLAVAWTLLFPFLFWASASAPDWLDAI